MTENKKTAGLTKPMGTLEKLGFAHCGNIICDEGTPRCAYQKDL